MDNTELEERYLNLKSMLRGCQSERETIMEKLNRVMAHNRIQDDMIKDLESNKGTRAADQLVRLGVQLDYARTLLDAHDAALRNRAHGAIAASAVVSGLRTLFNAPRFEDNK